MWCSDNDMIINTNKTKAMLLKSRWLKPSDEMCLSLKKQTIENVNEFKYLGLVLNSTLDYENHYESVCKSMTARLFMLHRHKKAFTPKWRHTFATLLVISKLDYCLNIWGKMSNTKLKRINNILLRLAKLIISPRNRNKLKDKIIRVEQLNWLLVHEKYEVYMLIYIYKHIWRESPMNCYFPQFIKRGEQKRCSRQENNFILPQMSTEFGKSTFFYQGILLWNELPNIIKQCQSVIQFDCSIREYEMSKRDDDKMLHYM